MDADTLARELTHALQDQHFSLNERHSPFENADRALAFRSLVEGDGILIELAYH